MTMIVLQFLELKQSIFDTLNKKSNPLQTKIGVPQGNTLGTSCYILIVIN